MAHRHVSSIFHIVVCWCGADFIYFTFFKWCNLLHCLILYVLIARGVTIHQPSSKCRSHIDFIINKFNTSDAKSEHQSSSSLGYAFILKFSEACLCDLQACRLPKHLNSASRRVIKMARTNSILPSQERISIVEMLGLLEKRQVNRDSYWSSLLVIYLFVCLSKGLH